MTDSERLSEIINSSGMSTKKFGEYIGTKSPQVLYDVLKGRNGISKELADKIHAKCVNYEYAWILTGNGNMCVELKDGIVYAGGMDEQSEIGKLIPFYDDVSTIGGINERSASLDAVSQPTEYIDAGDWFRDATAAIRHYGESMMEYPTGCILAIKEVFDRELIVPGRDYVVETSEYRVTKRIQKGKEPGYITAYSTNQETYNDGRLVHEPFDIPLRAVVRMYLVLGYVVKKNGGTMVFTNQKAK